MAEKLGKGALFTNTYKDKENQPDMRGNITIDEKEMQIAGWSKKDKNDNLMYSLQVTEKPVKTD
jgi:hypothetical protein